MNRHTIPLGRLFGIRIDVDYSWFLIFILLTWMLAGSYYPSEFKHWSLAEYWLMGAVTALMLFISVLLHELGHSAVALRYRIPVRSITLFIFGGVSQITGEPPSASAEFLIAMAGPVVSFALAAIFWALEPLAGAASPALALLKYLAIINAILGLFNLIPGFPLDGGRVLRSIVWGLSHNLRRATLIAANTGRFFGFLFIVWGVWQMLGGHFLNGLWIAFIGWFLESAAVGQVQQQVFQGLLLGHKVSEAMGQAPIPIADDTTLQDLVDQHLLGWAKRSFIVNQDGRLAGLLTLQNISKVPRHEWATTRVGQAMIQLEKLQSVGPDTDLRVALEKMGRDGVNQLPVMSQERMVGLLSRDDVVNYLATLQKLTA